MSSIQSVFLIGSAMLFISIFVSNKISSKLGVPMLLLFLLIGMLCGCDGLGIEFSDMKLAQNIGTIALCIILFSGGIGTKFKDIKPVLTQGILLSTLGVALTTFLTGGFVYLIGKYSSVPVISLPICLLLAATMSSTDSASVFNILRGQKIGLKNHLGPMLELESGSNDPMAYMLTIVLIQVCLAGQGTGNEISAFSIVTKFFIQFIVGALIGFISGKLAVKSLNKMKLGDSSLYPVIVLSLIFFIYSLTDILKGNGYLAIYIAAIIMGNSKFTEKRKTVKFLEGLTWLSQAIMFLCLGLLVTPHELLDKDIVITGVIIGTFMVFIGRPLSVFISLIPFRKPDFRSRLFVSWVGLKGAAPILFATYPAVSGVEGADAIFDIVFLITLISLLLQGATIPLCSRLLKLNCELPKEGNSFNVNLPEDMDNKLWDETVSEEMLSEGRYLKDLRMPSGVLVMMIRRGREHFVPRGDFELQAGDVMLLISQETNAEENL